MPATALQINGINAVLDMLDLKKKDIHKRAEIAMNAVAEEWSTDSKRLTPVDLGTLRSSIHTEVIESSDKAIRVRVVAGGPAAPYAVFVHENLKARHAVGQAKYIETVSARRGPNAGRDVASIMKRI